MNITPTQSGTNGNEPSENQMTSPPDLKDIMHTGESLHTVHIHITRRMLIILAILLICPCLIVTAALIYPQVSHSTTKSFTSHSDESGSSHISQGKPGPWGQLIYAHVMIDIPDEFVQITADQPPMLWFFPEYTKDRVIALFKSADISQTFIDKHLSDIAWQSNSKGTYLTPGDEFILGLSPEARSKIYAVLITTPENDVRLDPVWFRPESIDKQLDESGLSQSSIKLLKSLLYHNGTPLLLFADKDTALRQIKDDSEKRLFIKAISRKSTLMARLKIDAASDVEALANYWGVGGGRKDILPLMTTVQQVEGGWNLNLIYLLPHFIRERLYKYPFPSADVNATKQDCFWSALNVFNLVPDDRFNDMEYTRRIVDNDYYQINQPSQLGDLVFLGDSNNQAMHVAVYVADDIVFTKNGYHYTQPWILMHQQDMVETYAAHLPSDKPIKVLYYRRKNM